MQSALPQGHIRYRSSFHALHTICAQEGFGPRTHPFHLRPLLCALCILHFRSALANVPTRCSGCSGDLSRLHGHPVQLWTVFGLLLRILRAVQVRRGPLALRSPVLLASQAARSAFPNVMLSAAADCFWDLAVLGGCRRLGTRQRSGHCRCPQSSPARRSLGLGRRGSALLWI